jgi:hypothetical protein
MRSLGSLRRKLEKLAGVEPGEAWRMRMRQARIL